MSATTSSALRATMVAPAPPRQEFRIAFGRLDHVEHPFRRVAYEHALAHVHAQL
jgi:hypothetical protein